MKKLIFFLLLGLVKTPLLFCQSHFEVASGAVSFRSEMPIATIAAHNRQPNGFLNGKTGALYIELQVQDFVFPIPLMREHFNHDFAHSERYPTASFSGNVLKGDLPGNSSGWKKTVKVEGYLTFHGVTRWLTFPAQMENRGGQLTAKAEFPISPADYGVEVPSILRAKIAKLVNVSVQLVFTQPEATTAKTR